MNEFYKVCNVNSDSALEVNSKFDEDGNLFFAVYEELLGNSGAFREQSVRLTKPEVEKLIEHLTNALYGV